MPVGFGTRQGIATSVWEPPVGLRDCVIRHTNLVDCCQHAKLVDNFPVQRIDRDGAIVHDLPPCRIATSSTSSTRGHDRFGGDAPRRAGKMQKGRSKGMRRGYHDQLLLLCPAHLDNSPAAAEHYSKTAVDSCASENPLAGRREVRPPGPRSHRDPRGRKNLKATD